MEDTSPIRFLDLMCLTLLGAATAYGLISYGELPDIIPTHFNGKGEPDAKGPKVTIWIYYGIMVFTYLSVKWACRFSLKSKPETLRKWGSGYKGLTDEQIRKYADYSVLQMTYMNLIITAIMVYIFIKIILIAAGHGTNLGVWLLPVLFISIAIPIVNLIRYRWKL